MWVLETDFEWKVGVMQRLNEVIWQRYSDSQYGLLAIQKLMRENEPIFFYTPLKVKLPKT